MKCPLCHQDNDRVIDSRACEDGFVIRRRRECQFCGRRFTTYERIERSSLKVVKRDGTREPFSREKLRTGLEIACRKRPIKSEQIEEILTYVENEVENRFDNEVESQFLGEILMEKLFSLDQIAFVRFASVYRQFNDAQDFVEVLKPMLGKKNKSK
ncbi:MAG: transcriptional repressor NrdR [Thermoguttaceae bacterium]|nr:transcriptional repressor NrdR [Thermoguttaceae bacterium]MBR0190565.1 transcriptional repressor NrdR [Thermoguttaceae bacterium]